MSLQTRLGAFITAVGADIKTLTTDKLSKVSRPDEYDNSTGLTTSGDKMQWKRLSNGAVVAQEFVQASDMGGGAVLGEDYKSVRGAGSQGAAMHLSAEDSAGTKFSRLSVIDSGSGSPTARRTVRASLHADNNTTVLFRKILSSDGTSDFIVDTDWVACTFVNGVTNYGNNWVPLSYRYLSPRAIHLLGMALLPTGLVAGSQIAGNLPSTAFNQMCPSWANGIGGAGVTRFDVNRLSGGLYLAQSSYGANWHWFDSVLRVT